VYDVIFDLVSWDLRRRPLTEGIILGLVWFPINVALDLLMFMPEGPMRMTVADYMKDIGLTYLIIPAMTIGFGHLSEKGQVPPLDNSGRTT